MSHRLILLRHATAAPGAPDPLRPLTPGGELEALAVAEKIQELGWNPDFALVSHATRAAQTWSQARDVLGDCEVSSCRVLYEATLGGMQTAMDQIPEEAHTVLVVGHNPSLEYLVLWLTGERVQLAPSSAALLDGRALTWGSLARTPESMSLVQRVSGTRLTGGRSEHDS